MLLNETYEMTRAVLWKKINFCQEKGVQRLDFNCEVKRILYGLSNILYEVAREQRSSGQGIHVWDKINIQGLS